MPWTAVFWKNESGRYVFTCPLGNDDFEVTVRILRPSGAEDPSSWGRSFNLNGLLLEFNDFCQPVRTILQLAAQGKTQEFALFAGPRLKHVISHRNTVLIGDAAHPFLGHFGSGAGFALEDTYVLGRVLEWAWQRDKPLSNALELFDSIRSPHYDNLYATADKAAAAKKRILAEGVSTDDEIKRRVLAVSEASESWMYDYDIAEVTDEAIQQANLAIRRGEMAKEVATEQSTSQL
jgi:salicylate hydroxylase